MISQSTFFIPPAIQAGLESGDLFKNGSVVRNQLGRIVKLLDEIPMPSSEDQKAVARGAHLLRNPRILVPTLVVGTVAAGTAAVVVARNWWQRAAASEVPECVESYNASLATYLEAVQEGRLDANIIDRLLSDLDAVSNYSDQDGKTITLDLSSKHAATLVRIVIDSTRQLADENSIEVPELQQSTPEAASVVDLRRYLEAQKKIFTDVA